jgi:NAD(P)-dependent dehydrogenase (short-subunit alcohol dehydrogenase family)
MRLKDKVVIVTGTATGIGAACVRRFAEEGAAIVATDIVADKGEALAAEVRATGARVEFLAGDAAADDHIAAVVARAMQAFRRIDGCVCAAGIAPNDDFLQLSRERFERTLAVNLTGPMLLSQAAAREMVKTGGGAIVHVTSTSARLGGPLQAAYCASKGGLDGLTRAMAVALAPHRIRVNALAPGPTKTALAEAVWDKDEIILPILSRTPMGRFAAPSEQASVAAFLLSDDASFMTGETVYVDGGRTALNYTIPVQPGQR